MGGIGDELPLLLPCLLHRPDRPAGQQETDAKEDQKAGDTDEDTASKQVA